MEISRKGIISENGGIVHSSLNMSFFPFFTTVDYFVLRQDFSMTKFFRKIPEVGDSIIVSIHIMAVQTNPVKLIMDQVNFILERYEDSYSISDAWSCAVSNFYVEPQIIYIDKDSFSIDSTFANSTISSIGPLSSKLEQFPALIDKSPIPLIRLTVPYNDKLRIVSFRMEEFDKDLEYGPMQIAELSC